MFVPVSSIAWSFVFLLQLQIVRSSWLLDGWSFLLDPSSLLLVFLPSICFKHSRSKVLFFLTKPNFLLICKIWHPSKFHVCVSSTKGVWHVIAWHANNATHHLSNMLARDSVILLLSATMTVRIYLFTSPPVRCRRIEPKKYSRLSRMFLQEPSRYCLDQLFVW